MQCGIGHKQMDYSASKPFSVGFGSVKPRKIPVQSPKNNLNSNPKFQCGPNIQVKRGQNRSNNWPKRSNA